MSTKSALVLITAGSEELETVSIVDILRRAQVEVCVACLESTVAPLVCSRDVLIQADTTLSALVQQNKAEGFDALILPGGMGGAKAFESNPHVQSLIKCYAGKSDRIVAAICAAPIALHAAGVFTGDFITSHPAVQNQLTKDYKYSEERVVSASQGRLITSRGPGTALEFALTLVLALRGQDVLKSVMAPLLLHPSVNIKL